MKSKKTMYYALSFTWGILMTIVGGCAAAFLTLVKKVKPIKYGPCWCFVYGTGWGGVSLGPVMIMSEGNAKGLHTKNHEFGHSLQNCIYGPLFPLIVALPSVCRYNYRNHLEKKGTPPTTDYDAVWFEGQATKWGYKCIEYFN